VRNAIASRPHSKWGCEPIADVAFIRMCSAAAFIAFFNDCSEFFRGKRKVSSCPMAKHRHRTFEMFDHQEEAAQALGSKATRATAEVGNPEEWTFHQLFTSRLGTVIHVRFKAIEEASTTAMSELREDFLKLADSLVNDSQVMLDFEGVRDFGVGAIDALELLNGKLKSKGSRLTLCNLEPAVQASFFPHRKVAENRS